ncbi:MAG: NDP-hexose 3-C-methyltransferase [Candidatus Daviesbacteria bacterium GW2011_GWB1_36_5]|uniref:NDP-hexose 3-C-methyltransferase n=1 Tax=Candidatus Daviesbacteria bacterium GW2011_GWB1_36_5 TaxID=1618426 RepID=A0A0G0HEU8_9BACT|nr:MAG: NDP-hexose 3-C-methyltransferase [Candidatus Daviesbacteria bacterium GW2011_GWB1_36_5]
MQLQITEKDFTKSNSYKLSQCRLCKNNRLKKIINLGNTPPANSFLNKTQINKFEPFFPLHVNFCPVCRQLQLSHVVSPDILFRDYVYVSSTSPVFIKHFEDYAKDTAKAINLKRGALVVDIGSNDGILLKPFKKLGMRVVGVDPATKIAQKVTKEGIKTYPDYLTEALAEKIVKKHGQALAITANNVFAHVDNLDQLTKAAKILLNKEGVFIIEAPYLIVLLQKNLFDTIYHEHLSYLSLKPLVGFFKNHGMKIIDVWETGSHGGSIRVFVSKVESKRKINPSVKKLLKKEEKLGLDNLDTYIKFANRIKQNKKELTALLKALKKKGVKIAGFGAPAKGNTLLNYFKIGNETLDYIVDDSTYKQSLLTPGTHIPVVSPKILKTY